MKFRLLGQDVAISEAAESYNTYRKLFIGQAKTAANQFFDAYERNQSLEDVVRKTPDQIAACIAPSVELCIQILVDHGVYTMAHGNSTPPTVCRSPTHGLRRFERSDCGCEGVSLYVSVRCMLLWVTGLSFSRCKSQVIRPVS